MQDIVELTVLSRDTIKLPEALMATAESFEEGWNFIRFGNVHWPDGAVRRCGGHFVWIAEPSLRSGVGQTAQAAIGAALKLALRRLNPGADAANVDSIQLIQYPWFVIARVGISPYHIHADGVPQSTDANTSLPMVVQASSGLLSGTAATAC